MEMDETIIEKLKLVGDALMEIAQLLTHAGKSFLILLITPFILTIGFFKFTSMHLYTSQQTLQ